MRNVQKTTELRKEIEAGFTRIREEINQGKIYQAEQHVGYMRNWLAILTVTISVVLFGFGFLGYTHTSDIEAYRKQIAADAADVKALSTGVRENAKTVADSVDSIRTYQQRVAELDSKMKATDVRVTNTDKNIAAIEERSEAQRPSIECRLGVLGRHTIHFKRNDSSRPGTVFYRGNKLRKLGWSYIR
jgi:hypothetical protein